MKSKKAQTLGLAIIIAITLFIVGMVVVNIMKDEVTRTRGATQLNCANPAAISDGTKITCLVVDFVIPYFFILVISIAGGVITSRFVGK